MKHIKRYMETHDPPPLWVSIVVGNIIGFCIGTIAIILLSAN